MVITKINKKVCVTLAATLIFGAAAIPVRAAPDLDIKITNEVYERVFFDLIHFSFNFKLTELTGSKDIEALVKKIIYNNKTAKDYIAYIENQFVGNVSLKNYPPPSSGAPYQSEYTEQIEIPFASSKFIVAKQQIYFYRAPAAHGLNQTKYYIIDIKARKELSLAELLRPLPETELERALQAKYKTNINTRSKIWPPDTISFEKDGLLMVWNAYTIAPYSTGAVELKLPYATVSPYLTERGTDLRDQRGLM